MTIAPALAALLLTVSNVAPGTEPVTQEPIDTTTSPPPPVLTFAEVDERMTLPVTIGSYCIKYSNRGQNKIARRESPGYFDASII